MVNFSFHKRGDRLLFILALAVLAGALLSLAVRPRRAKEAGQENATPEIVFTHWWQDDLEKEALLELIRDFESTSRDFKITLYARSYEDLRFGLFNPAVDSPADIVSLDPLWVPELKKRGVLDYAEKPLLSFLNVLYYNTGILTQAGFSRPPKTRGEFLACARAVTAMDGNHWGLALGGGSSRGMFNDVYPWFWSAGQVLIEEGKPVINTRAVTESLSFLATLNSESLIVPGALSAGTERKLDDFISGRTAFMIASAADIELMRERMGESAFGITSVPVPDNYAGRSFYAITGWTAGIHSASAYKEEARIFIDFLAANASRLQEKIPGNGAMPSPDPFYSKIWDIAISAESAEDFFGMAGEHELQEIFREELAGIFSGSTSPAGAAASIQDKWTVLLSSM